MAQAQAQHGEAGYKTTSSCPACNHARPGASKTVLNPAPTAAAAAAIPNPSGHSSTPPSTPPPAPNTPSTPKSSHPTARSVLRNSPSPVKTQVAGAVGIVDAVLSQRALGADAPAAVLVGLEAVLDAISALAVYTLVVDAPVDRAGVAVVALGVGGAHAAQRRDEGQGEAVQA